jgi:2-methylcitrate dehydratase
MVYIIATLLRKAYEKADQVREAKDSEDLWKTLMLTPLDYGKEAILDETTKKIM